MRTSRFLSRRSPAMLPTLLICVVLSACSSSDEDDLPQDDLGASPVITRDNHVEILSQVFRIFVGDTYSEQLLRLRDDFIAVYEYDGSIPASYTCVNGGTALMVDRWDYEFENCLVGETLYEGQVSQGIPDGPGTYGYAVTSGGITLDRQPISLIRFSGTGRRWDNCSKADFIKSWYTSNINYEVTGVVGTLTILNASTTFDSGYYVNYDSGTVASMAGGFELSSPVTSNQSVTVETLSEFKYNLNNSSAAAAHVLLGDTGGYFPVGSLRLSTATTDLVLKADNGDDDTVDITLTVDGESEVFAQPWSLWGADLKFFGSASGSSVRATCL